MSMGPSIKSLNYSLWYVGMLCQIDLSNVIDMKEGTFWIVVNVLLSIAPIYIALFIVIHFDLKSRFPDSYLISVAASFAMVLLPFFGNVIFMPYIGILLSVFICYETSGDDLGDSFLEKDCYENCWQDEHLLYAIFTGLALVLYEPLSVYMRPLWQELQHDLNIITSPHFIMTKTAF
jgi:hypothetical protein